MLQDARFGTFVLMISAEYLLCPNPIISGPMNARMAVGFLGDVRRLNVAITRARHALWVVGDSRSSSLFPTPFLLSTRTSPLSHLPRHISPVISPLPSHITDIYLFYRALSWSEEWNALIQHAQAQNSYHHVNTNPLTLQLRAWSSQLLPSPSAPYPRDQPK